MGEPPQIQFSIAISVLELKIWVSQVCLRNRIGLAEDAQLRREN